MAVRLFVEEEIGTGVTVSLSPDQSHYLKNVMRLGVGSELVLFNGRAGEWLYMLTGLDKKVARASPLRLQRPQEDALDIWLCFAPIKRGPLEFVIEKATELGVGKFCPVLSRRTEVQRLNSTRLRTLATEAAEQCERLEVPEILVPVRLDVLLSGWPTERLLYVAAERQRSAPALPSRSGPAALLIGPEGGFTPDEMVLLARFPFVRFFSLGPRILRAETASLAALALWTAQE
jgi:16S rRNA (uracil1498-N3)-methyltransferase